MKRINIIDVPLFETDPKVIVEQLTTFLKDFRKKKLAADLIGDDERSAEFNVKDFGTFANNLSEGDAFSYRDSRRITERANKLAKDRVAAAGASHLKREEYDRLEPSLAGMQGVMAKDQNWWIKSQQSCTMKCRGWRRRQNKHGMLYVARHSAVSLF